MDDTGEDYGKVLNGTVILYDLHIQRECSWYGCLFSIFDTMLLHVFYLYFKNVTLTLWLWIKVSYLCLALSLLKWTSKTIAAIVISSCLIAHFSFLKASWLWIIISQEKLQLSLTVIKVNVLCFQKGFISEVVRIQWTDNIRMNQQKKCILHYFFNVIVDASLCRKSKYSDSW